MPTDTPSIPRHWLLRSLDLETSRETDPARVARDGWTAFREALDEAWTAGADGEQVRRQLAAFAGRLTRAQGGNRVLAEGLQRAAAALPGGRDAVLAEIDALLSGTQDAEQAVIAAAEPLFRPGARAITLGYSSLLAGMLTRYGDRLEMVTICEGRPLNEGARLAAEVAALAIPVRLITEAQLALAVPQCDLAVVAASRILPDGSAVGPMGTAVLAFVCKGLGVPFHVAAPQALWAAEGTEHARFRAERRSPAEVLSDPPQGVQVSNYAHDCTPARLISGYVSEAGLRGPFGDGSTG
jgi:translation initiation factor 2B subunit (eIF-2B alpha/beta/delta family)